MFIFLCIDNDGDGGDFEIMLYITLWLDIKSKYEISSGINLHITVTIISPVVLKASFCVLVTIG
jgi:hypothetical protein